MQNRPHNDPITWYIWLTSFAQIFAFGKNFRNPYTIGTDDADRDFLGKLASKTELSVKVLSDRLKQGITSMAKMLPLSGKGGK